MTWSVLIGASDTTSVVEQGRSPHDAVNCLVPVRLTFREEEGEDRGGEFHGEEDSGAHSGSAWQKFLGMRVGRAEYFTNGHTSSQKQWRLGIFGLYTRWRLTVIFKPLDIVDIAKGVAKA